MTAAQLRPVGRLVKVKAQVISVIQPPRRFQGLQVFQASHQVITSPLMSQAPKQVNLLLLDYSAPWSGSNSSSSSGLGSGSNSGSGVTGPGCFTRLEAGNSSAANGTFRIAAPALSAELSAFA